MSQFDIRNFVHLLTLDGGTQLQDETSYFCPVCNAPNFKIKKSNGYWSTFSCDCALTESGKRQIREKLSPAIKPVRGKDHRKWIYYDENGFPLIQVNRTDSGDGQRKFWQEPLVGREKPSQLAKRVKPYKYKEAKQELLNGHDYVFWVEGESCADALWRIGLPAISILGGSKFDPNRDINLFKPEQIVLVPDLDLVGINYMKKVAGFYKGCKILHPYPDSFRWENPPKDKGLDIADWLGGGAKIGEILKQLETTTDAFITDAIDLKDKLENGLKKIDRLDPLVRACALVTLRNELKIGKEAFEKLINTMVDFEESDMPETFDEIMAKKDQKEPVIDDLLAVGLTLICGDGSSGKSSFLYELVESISNGTTFAGQFHTKQMNVLVIQKDETRDDFIVKSTRMDLNPSRPHFRMKWHFHPLMIPELIRWVAEAGTRVVVLDSLFKIAGSDKDILSPEFGLFIYRLNRIASKYNLAIIMVHHLNRNVQKGVVRTDITPDDIFGSRYIFNGSSDVWGLLKNRVEGSTDWKFTLKSLKSRSQLIPEGERYLFWGNETDFRFTFNKELQKEMVERKTKKGQVLELINSIPDATFTPKQVGEELGITSNNAGNILQSLHDAGKIGRKRATEIITGGNKPFLYYSLKIVSF